MKITVFPNDPDDPFGMAFTVVVLLIGVNVNLFAQPQGQIQHPLTTGVEADMRRVVDPIVPLRQRTDEIGKSRAFFQKRPSLRRIVAKPERRIGPPRGNRCPTGSGLRGPSAGAAPSDQRGRQ